MKNEISSIAQTYKIDAVIMEQVRPQYNSHTNQVLMWLQAAVLLGLYEINPNIQYDFIGASEWRAKLKMKQGRGITRDRLKPQSIQYVAEKYKVQVNDDEADAICIYDACQIQFNNEINWQ